VTEGVALLLMQKGLGVFAAQTAFKRAGIWAIVTLAFQIVIYKKGEDRSFAASMIWQLALLVFYGGLWLLPQRRLFRRPAVIYYARTWFLFRLLCMTASTLFYFNKTHSTGSCLYVIGNLFPFAIGEPLLLYYTLLQDSKWWQGQDIFQGRRDKDAEEIRSPLQGIDINLKSAQSLAASMDRMGKLTSSAAASLHSSASPRRGTSPNGPGDGAAQRTASGDANSENTATVQGGGAVKLLNFAYIALDKNKQLGSGSFSRVYQGRYRDQPCAIKLIFTVDLTVDVIKRVAAEAQLLSLIRHPNVVDILGVAVLPPSVCILLELCIHGSLGDTLRNTAAVTSAMCAFSPVLDISNEAVDNSSAVTAQSMRGFVNGFNSFVGYDRAVHPSAAEGGFSNRSDRSSSNVSALMSVSTGVGTSTSFNLTGALGGGGASAASAPAPAPPAVTVQQIQALSLSWSDRLYIAVGCARGLAALHTFSADLCHRDIKSFNFLIDKQLNAKISDLELGMAELLNSDSSRKRKKKRASQSSASAADGSSASLGDASDVCDSESRTSLAGTEILANWAAPEVIQGSVYTQAADVYSFALVMWEIMVGRVPFSEVKKQDDIRRKVLAGTRPMIPACFITGDNAAMFARYVDIMQCAWEHDPQQRPSIVEILVELEEMWHTSTQHLISTTDATLTADEAYLKHLSAQSARTGSVAGDDPLNVASLIPMQSAAPAPGPDERPSHAVDLSMSRASASWWQNSFASPKLGSGMSSHGATSAPFSVPGGPNSGASLAHQVLDNLRAEDDGAALHALESSGACYVLVLPVPPHEVVWATHSWCLMSGCDVADIVGKPLHTMPIFDSSSFVRIKSGSQRKGSLAAELEGPRSPFTELFNACAATIFGTDHSASVTAENATATSLFFKSLHSRYLHRARACHAIINVLDFSSRTWNISASQRTVNTFSRRFVNAVTGRSGKAPAHSADSGATGPGGAGSALIDTQAPVICSTFSVHAFPVYQRTLSSSPITVPSGAKAPRNKSAYFNLPFSKARSAQRLITTPVATRIHYILFFALCASSFSAGAPSYLQMHADGAADGETSPATPHSPVGAGLRGEMKQSESSSSLSEEATQKPDPAKDSGSGRHSDGAARSGALKAEHIALVCIQFSRLREPPQLMQPLPSIAPPAQAGSSTTASQVSGGSSRNSFRILSTTSSQTTMSVLPRRLTGSSNVEEMASQRKSCIEIPLSDYASSNV
jgi:serine/threonine protein kinase